MSENKAKVLAQTRNMIMGKSYEKIMNAGQAHSELTKITEYLESIACSLYALATEYDIGEFATGKKNKNSKNGGKDKDA